MAGGPGSYVFGAEEKKELMDVSDNASLFRYGDNLRLTLEDAARDNPRLELIFED